MLIYLSNVPFVFNYYSNYYSMYEIKKRLKRTGKSEVLFSIRE